MVYLMLQTKPFVLKKLSILNKKKKIKNKQFKKDDKLQENKKIVSQQNH